MTLSSDQWKKGRKPSRPFRGQSTPYTRWFPRYLSAETARRLVLPADYLGTSPGWDLIE